MAAATATATVQTNKPADVTRSNSFTLLQSLNDAVAGANSHSSSGYRPTATTDVVANARGRVGKKQQRRLIGQWTLDRVMS